MRRVLVLVVVVLAALSVVVGVASAGPTGSIIPPVSVTSAPTTAR